MRRQSAEVGFAAVVSLLVATRLLSTAEAASAPTTPPPCGLYEGDEFDASTDGPCVLPDGEVMASAIWIRRNPGTNVNYNVNWTYGGDHSKPNKGYAALHGCQGDTVTFNFAGGPHNVVLLAGSVGTNCDFTGSTVASATQDSPYTYVLSFANRNGYFVYADSGGDNCAKGSMYIQIIFHRPPTPKYGCYAAGTVVKGLPIYPPAPTDSVNIAAPVPKPSPPPPKPKPPPPPPKPKPHAAPHAQARVAPHPTPHPTPHKKPVFVHSPTYLKEHPQAKPHAKPHPKPHFVHSPTYLKEHPQAKPHPKPHKKPVFVHSPTYLKKHPAAG